MKLIFIVYDSFSQLKLAKKVLETASSTKSKMARRVIPGDTTIRFETSEGVDVIPTFDAFNLRDDLLRGIYAYGKFEALLCSKSAVIFIERRPCMLHWPMHADRASLTLRANAAMNMMNASCQFSTWIEPMVVINSQPWWGIGHWFVFKRVCVHCIMHICMKHLQNCVQNFNDHKLW